jgi:hypothetical protein
MLQQKKTQPPLPACRVISMRSMLAARGPCAPYHTPNHADLSCNESSRRIQHTHRTQQVGACPWRPAAQHTSHTKLHKSSSKPSCSTDTSHHLDMHSVCCLSAANCGCLHLEQGTATYKQTATQQPTDRQPTQAPDSLIIQNTQR